MHAWHLPVGNKRHGVKYRNCLMANVIYRQYGRRIRPVKRRWSCAPPHPHHSQLAQALSFLITSKRLRSRQAKVRTVSVREIVVNRVLVEGISGYQEFNCKQSFRLHRPNLEVITARLMHRSCRYTNPSDTLLIVLLYCRNLTSS